MKLQNTLFIATAIFFYILLCSQPADSNASSGLSNDHEDHDPKHCNWPMKKCRKPKKCYMYNTWESSGHCLHSCVQDGWCPHRNLKCVSSPNDGVCLRMTWDDVDNFPDCSSVKCEGNAICHAIRGAGTTRYKCLQYINYEAFF